MAVYMIIEAAQKLVESLAPSAFLAYRRQAAQDPFCVYLRHANKLFCSFFILLLFQNHVYLEIIHKLLFIYKPVTASLKVVIS